MYSQDTGVYHSLKLCHINQEFIPYFSKESILLFIFAMYCSFKNCIFNCPSNPSILSLIKRDKFAFVNIIFCSNCYKMYQCLGTCRKCNCLKVVL